MKKFIKETIESLLVAIVIVVILINFVFIKVQVIGDSMYPNLHDGDNAISFVITKNIKINRFDIAVIDQGEKLLVKRVIGLPYEKIEYRDNKLYVNGEYIAEPFIDDNVKTANFSVSLEDEYFCMGDNRNISKDSRSYGAFIKDQIKSTHLFVFTPFEEFGFKK